jgi:hypothetical protein
LDPIRNAPPGIQIMFSLDVGLAEGTGAAGAIYIIGTFEEDAR